METLPPQDISIENPQTLREVGIHLGTFSRQLEDIKITEKQHHLDNQTANNAILKKLDDMQSSYVTRTEFSEHEKRDEDHENRIRAIEKNMWRQIGASSIISAVVSLILAAIAQHFIH